MQRTAERARKQCQAYMIPSMEVADIATYLRDIGFPLEARDLQNPAPAHIQKLYEGILEVYTEEKIERVVSRTHSLQSVSEESLALVALYRRMKAFLGRIGVVNFHLRDVLLPERGKTVWILSCIVNFSFFKDNKRGACERITRSKAEVESIVESYEAELRSAQRDLDERLRQKRKNEELSEALGREVREKEKSLLAYHKEQQAFVTEIEAIKSEHGRCVCRLSEERLQITNLKEDILRLKTCIVENPEQFRELLNEMKGQVEAEKKLKHECGRRIRALSEQEVEFKAHTDKLQSLIYIVSMANEYRDKHEALQAEIVKCQNDNNTLSIQNEADIGKKHILEKKIAYICEKLDVLQAVEEGRLREMHAKLRALKEKHAGIVGEKENTQARILENNRLIKEMEYGLISQRNAHESLLSVLYSELIELKCLLKGYIGDISSLCKQELLP